MPNIDNFVRRLQAMPRRLFHFTDSRNLPSIRELGLLPTSELRARGIEIVTGGDSDSLGIDQHRGFDRYVRLSFCPSHPMSHVAIQRGNIEQLRILSICPTVLLRDGVLVADRVATANDAEIGAAEDMIERFDFQAAYEWLDWSAADGQARRHAAEKWEALIPEVIAPDLIRGF